MAAALAAGAAACLVEAEGVEAFGFDDDAHRRAARPEGRGRRRSPSRYYGDAERASCDVLAVTGTNGKTSTAWWMAQALSALGRRCGVIGTLRRRRAADGGAMPRRRCSSPA